MCHTSRLVVVLGIAVGSALNAQAPAPGLTALTGTWTGVCSSCAPGAMPAGFSKQGTIQLRGSALTITHDSYPAEVYPLDSSEVQLLDGRTARALVDQSGLIITTSRRRSPADGEYQTLMRDVYRLGPANDTLVVERSARVIRPGDTPGSQWAPIRAVDYTR